MKSRHVTEVLPLWVGGDLPIEDVPALEAHLRECAACQAVAGSLQQSRRWLQASLEPSFSQEERETFRGDTMARIRSEAASRTVSRRLGSIPRSWLLAAAALLLAFGTYHVGWRRSQGVPPRTIPPIPRVAVAAPQPPLSLHPAGAHLRPVRQRPLPKASPPGEAPAFARLELQTADPTIRIIWLAPAASVPGLSEPSNP